MSTFWNFEKGKEGAVRLGIAGRIGCDMARVETLARPALEADIFSAELDKYKGAARLDVVINSSGGHADVGLIVYAKLRWHPGFKSVTIEGAACSAAYMIALAGDHVSIAEDAYIMIHSTHRAVFGGPALLRSVADDLEKMNIQFAGILAHRRQIPEDQALQLFQNGSDTILDAEEALKLKLVDEIIPARNVQLNRCEVNRVLPEHKFVNDCFTCLSPCERCLRGDL